MGENVSKLSDRWGTYNQKEQRPLSAHSNKRQTTHFQMDKEFEWTFIPKKM